MPHLKISVCWCVCGFFNVTTAITLMASCILRPDYSADNFNTVCKRTQKIPFLTGLSRPWPPWPQSLTAQRRRTCFVPREDNMDFFTAEKIIQKRPCPVVFFLSSKIPAMSCCFFFKNPGNVCFLFRNF